MQLPLSVSLKTLNLSRSDTIEDPRSVILNVWLMWSILADDELDILFGLTEVGDAEAVRDVVVEADELTLFNV